MIHMRKYFIFILFFILSFYSLPLYGADHMGHGPTTAKDAGVAQKPVFVAHGQSGKQGPHRKWLLSDIRLRQETQNGYSDYEG